MKIFGSSTLAFELPNLMIGALLIFLIVRAFAIRYSKPVFIFLAAHLLSSSYFVELCGTARGHLWTAFGAFFVVESLKNLLESNNHPPRKVLLFVVAAFLTSMSTIHGSIFISIVSLFLLFWGCTHHFSKKNRIWIIGIAFSTGLQSLGFIKLFLSLWKPQSNGIEEEITAFGLATIPGALLSWEFFSYLILPFLLSLFILRMQQTKKPLADFYSLFLTVTIGAMVCFHFYKPNGWHARYFSAFFIPLLFWIGDCLEEFCRKTDKKYLVIATGFMLIFMPFYFTFLSPFLE